MSGDSPHHIIRWNAPGSGMRPDQVLAIVQAFEQLLAMATATGLTRTLTYRRFSCADSQRVDVDAVS